MCPSHVTKPARAWSSLIPRSAKLPGAMNSSNISSRRWKLSVIVSLRISKVELRVMPGRVTSLFGASCVQVIDSCDLRISCIRRGCIEKRCWLSRAETALQGQVREAVGTPRRPFARPHELRVDGRACIQASRSVWKKLRRKWR